MNRKIRYIVCIVGLLISSILLLQTPFTGFLGFKHGSFFVDKNPVGYWMMFCLFVLIFTGAIFNLKFLIKTRKGIITREKDIRQIQAKLHMVASNESKKEKLYLDRSTIEYWRFYLMKDDAEKYVLERITRSQAEELFKILPHAAL
jgi:hypothetical protein